MSTVLTFIVVGLFISMLFLNFYFRFKTMKVYKRLMQGGVQLSFAQLFNREKAEKAGLQHPRHRQDILALSMHIRRSIGIAVTLIGLMAALGVALAFLNK